MNNKNIVLIMGPPNSGKSAALMRLKNQHEMAYLNTDLKPLPFADNFAVNVEVSDAKDVLSYIEQIEDADAITGGVLDTLSFLMSMYERQYVSTVTDPKLTGKAWGEYANFYGSFIHAIKAGTKDYAILAHEKTDLNEQAMQFDTRVPVKGAVGKIGVEADFTTILSCKQISIAKLEGHENDLLRITDEEEEDGFKRVFCTRITKETVGEKMRSAIGLWDRKELYIDNDLEQVFARLKQYYNKPVEVAA